MKYDKQLLKTYYNKCGNLIKDKKIIKEFHFELTNICNFNCKYCYARWENNWGSINIFKKDVLKILKLINIDKYNKDILLLGGEPTLHPQYFDILEAFYKETLNLNKIVVITNFSSNKFKDINECIKKHSIFKDKILFVVSFHPSEIKDLETFKKNIILFNKNFDLVLNVILLEKYSEITNDFLKFCLDNNINFRFGIIYNKNEEFMYSSSGYKNFLKDINEKFGSKNKNLLYFKDNKLIAEYNDIDSYLNNFNIFTNFKCENFLYQCTKNNIKNICNDRDFIPNDNIDMICDKKFCICTEKNTQIKYLDV